MGNELIRIEHLSKVFNGAAGRIVALDDINLSIEEGDIFGIIGLSGAGKSTLVRCMNLLEVPTEGRVVFDGRNLMEMSQRELLATRQSIGMIFQDFNLMAQRNARFQPALFALGLQVVVDLQRAARNAARARADKDLAPVRRELLLGLYAQSAEPFSRQFSHLQRPPLHECPQAAQALFRDPSSRVPRRRSS